MDMKAPEVHAFASTQYNLLTYDFVSIHELLKPLRFRSEKAWIEANRKTKTLSSGAGILV